MKSDLGHWNYNGPEVDINQMIGFIYCITDNNGKKYIGKKLLLNKKKRNPLKGRVNARRYTVESDWRVYTGSSPVLNEYISNGGKDKFQFEILSFQPSKLLMAYYETKEIIDRNALFRDDYYNEVLNCRFRKHKVKYENSANNVR
jgi:hypothetical protein